MNEPPIVTSAPQFSYDRIQCTYLSALPAAPQPAWRRRRVQRATAERAIERITGCRSGCVKREKHADLGRTDLNLMCRQIGAVEAVESRGAHLLPLTLSERCDVGNGVLTPTLVPLTDQRQRYCTSRQWSATFCEGRRGRRSRAALRVSPACAESRDNSAQHHAKPEAAVDQRSRANERLF